jgi:hypothetical protein
MRERPGSVLVCAMIACALCACSDDGAAPGLDTTVVDAKVAGDVSPGQDLSPGQDVNPVQDASPVQDAVSDKGQAQDLTSPGQCGKTCTGGLSCVCCGSIGPKPICICSTTCASDADCKDKALPSCNKATPTSAAGICTTKGFNCCWFCK